MKVQKETELHWSIRLKDGRVVGSIQQVEGFNGKVLAKYLYVNEKRICKIKNQKEALEELEKFIAKNKEDIKIVELHIEELKIGINDSISKICVDALNKELDIQEKLLETLKSYDLI